MTAGSTDGAGALAFYLLSSARLSDQNLRRLALAYEVQLTRDLAPEWGLLPPTVTVVSAAADVPDNGIPVLFTPTIDVSNADAYHSLTTDGRVFCRVLTDDTMSLPDIEEAGSHELCETAPDPPCNRWATRTDATGIVTSYALEVCDGLEGTPEQKGSYTIDGGEGDPVRVANFCGRGWFADGPLHGAKLDYLGACSSAWQLLSPSSYAVTSTGGALVTLPIGTMLPARKYHCASRTSRRLRQVAQRQRRAEVLRPLLRPFVRGASVVVANALVDVCAGLGENELGAVLAKAGRDLAAIAHRRNMADIARRIVSEHVPK